jgi:elongation factor P--beta-lysine ligase
MGLPNFAKTPWEVFPIAVDFAALLAQAGAGVTLSSCAVTAADQGDESDAAAAVLTSPTAQVTGSLAAVEVKAGTLGHSYRLGFRGTLSNGVKREGTVIMRVHTSVEED